MERGLRILKDDGGHALVIAEWFTERKVFDDVANLRQFIHAGRRKRRREGVTDD
jgi:hypothetical protein